MPTTGEKKALEALRQLLNGMHWSDELRSFVLNDDALFDAANEALRDLETQKGAR